MTKSSESKASILSYQLKKTMKMKKKKIDKKTIKGKKKNRQIPSSFPDDLLALQGTPFETNYGDSCSDLVERFRNLFVDKQSSRQIEWPENIIVGILERLGVKSVLRFRLLSKSWNAIISKPLKLKPKTQLILLNSKDKYLVCTDNQDFEENKQFKSPFTRWRTRLNFGFVSCSNGVICIQETVSWNIILWNPSVRRYISLPKPNITPFSKKVAEMEGTELISRFLHHSKVNDHKVIIVVTIDKTPTLEANLYSHNQNLWKKISQASSDFGEAHRDNKSSVFVHDKLHWIGRRQDNDCVIHNVMRFDLNTENFSCMRLPDRLGKHENDSIVPMVNRDMYILNYKDSSIAIVKKDTYARTGFIQLQIWVMEDYGIYESWTQVYQLFERLTKKTPNILYFRRNEELLCQRHCGTLVTLNLNTNQMTDVGTEPKSNFTNVDSYEDGLLILSGDSYEDNKSLSHFS